MSRAGGMKKILIYVAKDDHKLWLLIAECLASLKKLCSNGTKTI
jgi:hypothetical protein